MKMIAFYNNKGGVGKTSTAINIAYTLSRRENRVLLIDFDGQCNSSRFFTDLTNDEIGCERAIVCTDEKPLIKKTRYDNIDIVTSSVRMNAISNEFVNLSDEEKQSNIIKFRQSTYDYIIVDMPPAMNDFTENVLTICDYVYVPIELGTFAVQGLARVTQKIANAGTKYACFASKYDKGNKADQELLEIMKKNLGDKVLNTVINLDLIMLNHTQRKYSDADIFKEHEELKKIFTQLEADGVEIKGRLREKIAKAMHVSSAQIGKIENIKNNAIDSVKVAVENGELSISTANEIAKHNATKQQEIISSPIEKIKTADVRNTNKDKSKAKTPKCDEPNNYSTSDEATEIYLTTDETMFMKKNLDILGFSYLLSVSSDSDKRIIENIISKIKGEEPNGKRC